MKNVLLALSFASLFTGLLVFGFNSGATEEKAKSSRPAVASTSEEASAVRRGELTLLDAIRIAEKLGRGKAFKAEKRERPEIVFRVEVLGWDGSKKKLELTADGKLMGPVGGTEEKKVDEKKKRGSDKRRADVRGGFPSTDPMSSAFQALELSIITLRREREGFDFQA